MKKSEVGIIVSAWDEERRIITKEMIEALRLSNNIGTEIRNMCCDYIIPEEFIDAYPDVFKHAWREISIYQNLSLEFKLSHKIDLHWDAISKEYEILTAEEIEIFYDLLNKTDISKYYQLTEEFVDKHFDDLSPPNLYMYQHGLDFNALDAKHEGPFKRINDSWVALYNRIED